MLLGAEIGLTVIGLYWLIVGKVSVNKTQRLAGWPVRILGFILILPVPIALCVGFAMGS